MRLPLIQSCACKLDSLCSLLCCSIGCLLKIQSFDVSENFFRSLAVLNHQHRSCCTHVGSQRRLSRNRSHRMRIHLMAHAFVYGWSFPVSLFQRSSNPWCTCGIALITLFGWLWGVYGHQVVKAIWSDFLRQLKALAQSTRCLLHQGKRTHSEWFDHVAPKDRFWKGKLAHQSTAHKQVALKGKGLQTYRIFSASRLLVFSKWVLHQA